jgi:hypothetical protein
MTPIYIYINHRYFKPALHTIIAVLSIVISFLWIGLSDPDVFWQILQVALVFTVFYAHALAFVPILLEKMLINRYVVLTFGLFSIGAVLLTIARISSWPDSIYVFSKIRYHGPGYGTNIENFYEVNFYFMLSLFAISFMYGVLASKARDNFNIISKLIFKENRTELTIHSVLILVLFISSYFAGIFLDITLIGSMILFYFHSFYTSPILLKYKQLNNFIIITLLEISLFCGILGLVSNLHFFTMLAASVTILTFASLYAFVKHQSREQKYLLAKNEIELQQLKSQVNPHFLFNSLNTIYSFALKENAENTAGNIIKLSNLIRYMLSDIKKDLIPLEKEVNYIKDFIDIQVARCSSEQKVELSFNNIEGHFIAPMLLMPFVENAFKHGIHTGEASQININIGCNEGTIFFNCSNSISKTKKTELTEQGFGIGIKNVKSRLELIYPNRYNLSITDKGFAFSVDVKINTGNDKSYSN